jgi:hypothetical protein
MKTFSNPSGRSVRLFGVAPNGYEGDPANATKREEFMRGQHSSLDPKALAIAGGVGAVALSLLFGFGMMGAGSMMGGGWMMGGYGGPGSYASHWSAGAGFFMLVTVLFVGLIAGWITALVYNAILSQSARQPETRTEFPSDKPAI